MQIFKTRNNLCEIMMCFLLIFSMLINALHFTIHYVVKELTFWSILHNYKDIAFSLDNFIHLSNRRMLSYLQNMKFSRNPLYISNIFNLCFLQYFYRNWLSCDLMHTKFYFTESTLS